MKWTFTPRRTDLLLARTNLLPERTKLPPEDDKPPPDLEDSLIMKIQGETSLHGFKYVVRGESSFEKTFWVVAILVAFLFALFMNYSYMQEVKDNPMKISLSTISASDIPFPAVTVDSGRIWNPMGFARKALSGFSINDRVKGIGCERQKWCTI